MSTSEHPGANDQPDERSVFLREEYRSLRDEVATLERMQRYLLLGGLSFAAAFTGYAFLYSKVGYPNKWLVSIVPLIIAVTFMEIFRSERKIAIAARHLQDIEAHLLGDSHRLGWETRHGDYAGGPPRLLDIPIFLVLIGAYAASTGFAIRTFPESRFSFRVYSTEVATTTSLTYVYIGLLVVLLAMYVYYSSQVRVAFRDTQYFDSADTISDKSDSDDGFRTKEVEQSPATTEEEATGDET